MPPPVFPPLHAVRADGLVMLGGELTSDWLLAAYRQGIFPWPIVDDELEILAWFSPDPRAIIELDQLHVSRRLARRLRSGQYRVTSDRAFAAVVAGCAAPRKTESGTWITPQLATGYLQLHRQGHAHSVEVWEEGQLVGGLYGVALGGYFSGESMFHCRRDASKVALVSLVHHLQQQGFCLLDIQQSTPHSQRMGAIEIPRPQFLARLREALTRNVTFGELSS